MNEQAVLLSQYLESGYVLVQVSTWEEERALEAVKQAGNRLKRPISTWTFSSGFGDHDGPTAPDPAKALDRIAATTDSRVFVLLDFHPALKDPLVVRKLRELCPRMISRGQGIVMVGAVTLVPIELEKETIILDFPAPGQEELSQILAEEIDSLGHSGPLASDRALRETVVRASLGLTAREARRMLRRVLISHPDFGREHVREVLEEKRQLLRRSDLLEFYDASESLDDVGGLDQLKKWLASRAEAFGEEARSYGLPAPRGLLLLGVQGCGKSLSAKAVSRLWGIPLIRLDLSAILGREAEGEKLRRSLMMAEGLAPCVLWIDEIEKGFSTHRISGAAEHGSMARAFASFLVWLQEKKSPVYVIATANSISEMPPELMRKGRFDEIFFVDLPQPAERKEIFRIHLQARKREPEAFDLDKLAAATGGFSGSEIEQVIISAMYDAFTQGREIETGDMLKSIRDTVPLSQTMEEQIKELRDWAKTRARGASLDTKLMDLLNGKKK